MTEQRDRPVTHRVPPKPIQLPEVTVTGHRFKKGTLAYVIGTVGGAAALFVSVPHDESGRTVKATVQPDQSITLQHVAGKQYLKTYLDIVKVPTACDGITGKNIRMGMTFTPAQCDKMLEEQLIAHAAPIIKCVPALYGREHQVIAAVGLSYNIGAAGVCKASIAQLWNKGLWAEGCDRFALYNKAGGKVVRGLVLRRGRERETCLTGLRPGYTIANLPARIEKWKP